MAELSKLHVRRPDIKVRLLGKLGELALSQAEASAMRGAELSVRLPEGTSETSPRKLIAQIAEENPLLRDQMIRQDGSPRSSTRILLNGKPPADLDQRMEVRYDKETDREIIVVVFSDGTVVIITDVVIIVLVPCDG
jgi:hypothetical protein